MRGKEIYQTWMILSISYVLIIFPCAGYGASLTIGNTVSVNGNMNATSFSGDGSGLTNVGGNSTCTPITSLPNTITAPGVYCLTSDLATNVTSGNAIEIGTDNVVINLNGHTIDGQTAGLGTTTNGIYAYQRQNITIKNGTVRGFFTAILLFDVPSFTTSQANIIENIRADMNTYQGINVYGRGNIIRNNQVVDTLGSTSIANANGIAIVGPGNRVINNDVYETKEQDSGSSNGIVAGYASGLVVENNRVGNAALGTGTSTGIMLVTSPNITVRDNTISMMNNGIYYNGGSGLYMNNLASGCTTPFTGGTPAGSTNYSIP